MSKNEILNICVVVCYSQGKRIQSRRMHYPTIPNVGDLVNFLDDSEPTKEEFEKGWTPEFLVKVKLRYFDNWELEDDMDYDNEQIQHCILYGEIVRNTFIENTFNL